MHNKTLKLSTHRCVNKNFKLTVHSAPAGDRTRARRVAGEDSTTEPTPHIPIRHLRITHLPVRDVAWNVIRASGDQLHG